MRTFGQLIESLNENNEFDLDEYVPKGHHYARVKFPDHHYYPQQAYRFNDKSEERGMGFNQTNDNDNDDVEGVVHHEDKSKLQRFIKNHYENEGHEVNDTFGKIKHNK
jgi:hypothetical protein